MGLRPRELHAVEGEYETTGDIAGKGVDAAADAAADSAGEA